MDRPRHRHVLFRLLLVATVVSGLLLQPVISALADLHALEHLAALDGDHGHHHDADPDHEHPPSNPADEGAPADPGGLHGILHASVGMGAIAVFDAPLFHSACPTGSDPPWASTHAGPITSEPTSPFRPPIA